MATHSLSIGFNSSHVTGALAFGTDNEELMSDTTTKLLIVIIAVVLIISIAGVIKRYLKNNST